MLGNCEKKAVPYWMKLSRCMHEPWWKSMALPPQILKRVKVQWTVLEKTNIILWVTALLLQEHPFSQTCDTPAPGQRVLFAHKTEALIRYRCKLQHANEQDWWRKRSTLCACQNNRCWKAAPQHDACNIADGWKRQRRRAVVELRCGWSS